MHAYRKSSQSQCKDNGVILEMTSPLPLSLVSFFPCISMESLPFKLPVYAVHTPINFHNAFVANFPERSLN